MTPVARLRSTDGAIRATSLQTTVGRSLRSCSGGASRVAKLRSTDGASRVAKLRSTDVRSTVGRSVRSYDGHAARMRSTVGHGVRSSGGSGARLSKNGFGTDG